ncbi:MAG TPA: DUF1761 domain-containing protein [Bacteroidetes bacterium]|nr:DUF1761 domain-containing protein [Bacteroidota bacterium]
MYLSNINWTAVLVATISAFVIGFVWYGPVFGRQWMKEIGLTPEAAKNANMLKVFGPAFILTLIMGLMLALHMHDNSDWLQGSKLAAMIALGFIAPTTGVNYIFCRKTITLWIIDCGYSLVTLCVMGAIIGAWH